MRLLPGETVRATAQHTKHPRLNVRVKVEDLPVLEKLATGGWTQYTVDSWVLLLSTPDTAQRLELNVYEPLTVHVPLKRVDKRRRLGEPATAPLHMQIAGIHMLPGKGSSMARRAIVTLRV